MLRPFDKGGPGMGLATRAKRARAVYAFDVQKEAIEKTGQREIFENRKALQFLICEIQFAILTSCLPILSPVKSPINALGAFSKPLSMLSLYLILPCLIHCAICDIPSGNRSL